MECPRSVWPTADQPTASAPLNAVGSMPNDSRVWIAYSESINHRGVLRNRQQARSGGRVQSRHFARIHKSQMPRCLAQAAEDRRSLRQMTCSNVLKKTSHATSRRAATRRAGLRGFSALCGKDAQLPRRRQPRCACETGNS